MLKNANNNLERIDTFTQCHLGLKEIVHLLLCFGRFGPGLYRRPGVALGLFVLRGASTEKGWSEKAVKLSFWGLNQGLAGMILLTLLPVGLGQLGVAVQEGYWASRDGAFYQIPWVKSLLWLRMLPDTVFIVLGVLPFLYLAVRVYLNRRPVTLSSEDEPAAAGTGVAGRTPAVRG